MLASRVILAGREAERMVEDPFRLLLAAACHSCGWVGACSRNAAEFRACFILVFSLGSERVEGGKYVTEIRRGDKDRSQWGKEFCKEWTHT